MRKTWVALVSSEGGPKSSSCRRSAALGTTGAWAQAASRKATTMIMRIGWILCLGDAVQGDELHGLDASFHGCLVHGMAGQVEARDLGRAPGDDQRTAVFLGEAFQARRGVHRVADRGDDLGARRPHRADE